MNRIMELMFRVLDIRITFFDLREDELRVFNIKGMSPFCESCRRDPDFNERCVKCDRKHLKIAKQKKQVHIYHCHAGMLEGIVPLYDQRGNYLGAIVFGQLQDRSKPVTSDSPHLRQISRKSTEREMLDIGNLLKYLSEYICENELIRFCNKPWAERLESYIDDHLSEPVSLNELAQMIGKSQSFLTHNFPLEFGMPLKAYIRQKKMEKALKLLQSGRMVRECAFELGYCDEFHFSKDFKRHFGYPPRQEKL